MQLPFGVRGSRDPGVGAGGGLTALCTGREELGLPREESGCAGGGQARDSQARAPPGLGLPDVLQQLVSPECAGCLPGYSPSNVSLLTTTVLCSGSGPEASNIRTT